MSDEATGTVVVEEAPAAAPRATDYPLYDFRRPRVFAPERLRALEAMYGGLCKSVERWLTTRVREPIALALGEFRSISLEDYARSLGTPTAAFLFDTGSQGRQAILDFGREFAFYLVDRLLGSNDPPRMPSRALTVLERMLVRMPAEKIAAQLRDAWKEHAALELTLTRFEAMPAMLQAGKREEVMLVATVAVATGGFNGAFTLALPQVGVESFFTPLNSRTSAAPPPLVPPGAATSLREVEVGVSVRTAPFTIRLGELGRIGPGTMLETGLSATADLTVRIEGIARFLAQPGRSGRRLAARVAQALTPAQQMAMATKGRTGPMASISQDNEKSEAGAFAELAASEAGPGGTLTSLYQVSLPVTIELGRTRMSVQEILALGRGSVIELDRLVGEPVDVMVGDRHFADGEVVVVGDSFGVRVTRVVANVESENGDAR